jgi:hypothetical protein
MGAELRWLEDDGWDLVSQAPLEARRQRGEHVETFVAGADGRLRYTVTRPIGEEDFRRVRAGDLRCKVITRAYAKTSVTAEPGAMSLRAALMAAAAAAREGVPGD